MLSVAIINEVEAAAEVKERQKIKASIAIERMERTMGCLDY
jgi:hypothetical protein